MMVMARGSSDPYYDLFEDWDLIISSFLSQYGLRIRTKEFESVSWDEFKSLVAGIAPDTVLGRIVAIRSETDKDVIKHFTTDQKRIYDEWHNRQAAQMSPQSYDQQMEYLERQMAWLCGG
ncbi:Gp15 family bacteriophage protein [Hungatella hathewayi]|uniref:Gp15 family bacteriophage protein n=1 Tax=Hungatella hathewayi TaxID=154046 RepID=UPI0035688CD4